MRRSTAAASVLITAALSVGLSGTASAAPDLDCSNFATQPEAQAAFIQAGGPAMDPNDLDRDNDGMACDSLPGGSGAQAGGDEQVSVTPVGAVAAGDGSSREGGTLPYVLGGVALTAAGGAAFAARRSAQQSA